MSEYILMIQFDDESTKENQSAFFLQEKPDALSKWVDKVCNRLFLAI
jgi:hypothetical protein